MITVKDMRRTCRWVGLEWVVYCIHLDAVNISIEIFVLSHTPFHLIYIYVSVLTFLTLQTVTPAITAPNFTEFGFGLVRGPQELSDTLRDAIRTGYANGDARLEHDILEFWHFHR